MFVILTQNNNKNNDNNSDGRKHWVLVDRSMALVVVMVLWVCTHPQTHRGAYIKNTQFSQVNKSLIISGSEQWASMTKRSLAFQLNYIKLTLLISYFFPGIISCSALFLILPFVLSIIIFSSTGYLMRSYFVPISMLGVFSILLGMVAK